MKKFITALLLTSTVFAVTLEEAQTIVAKRKDAMEVIAKQLKTMSSNLKDNEKVLAALTVVQAKLAEAQPLFEVDTHSFKTKTEALPIIWTQKADFDSKYNEAIQVVNNLITKVKANSATVDDFKSIQPTCKACHSVYKD